MGQIILNGAEKLSELISGRKVLLVSTGLGRYPIIQEIVAKADFVQFSGFSPNPLYEQVCEGVRVFNAENCDTVLAVGGGSAIDVAKCVKLYCRMDPDICYLEQKTSDTGIPLIAIPTTAGTGSESTKHAVYYFKGEKQSISHPSILPNYALLVPSVLYTLPDYQRKCTMLDALCQAIESWWSVNSCDESMGYSRQAVELIRDNWRDYIFDGSQTAAASIQLASNYAGRAINITATTAAHAMSYKITSMYKFPHGHAVAVCMREVWEYMLSHTDLCIDARGQEHLRNVFDSIPVDLTWFKDLMDLLGMERPVSSSRVSDIEYLVSSVNPVRLKNNPVALSSETLKYMYERIVL